MPGDSIQVRFQDPGNAILTQTEAVHEPPPVPVSVDAGCDKADVAAIGSRFIPYR